MAGVVVVVGGGVAGAGWGDVVATGEEATRLP